MPSNMDVFLKQNEQKDENLPKVSEDAVMNAQMDMEAHAKDVADFFASLPRKTKRKILPQAKFANQLMKKFQNKKND